MFSYLVSKEIHWYLILIAISLAQVGQIVVQCQLKLRKTQSLETLISTFLKRKNIRSEQWLRLTKLLEVMYVFIKIFKKAELDNEFQQTITLTPEESNNNT